ncbi:MAG: class I SAM-dependent methyltransferase [Candidatus Berkiella sp.]
MAKATLKSAHINKDRKDRLSNRIVSKSVYLFTVFVIIIFMVISVSFAQDGTTQKPKDTRHTRWENYFKSKLNDPPAGFVVSGLQYIDNNHPGKVALDLGAGVGHETMVLLKQGYNVIAVDGEENAFKYMMALPGIQNYRSHLRTIVSDFEKLNFKDIPPTDLVVASFALPFVPAKEFDKVWGNVVNTIKPGGYIIVNLFDSSFSFIEERFRPSMTFHTKEQALSLFKQFNIIYFNEVMNDATKPGTQNHYYVFIAKKRNNNPI